MALTGVTLGTFDDRWNTVAIIVGIVEVRIAVVIIIWARTGAVEIAFVFGRNAIIVMVIGRTRWIEVIGEILTIISGIWARQITAWALYPGRDIVVIVIVVAEVFGPVVIGIIKLSFFDVRNAIRIGIIVESIDNVITVGIDSRVATLIIKGFDKIIEGIVIAIGIVRIGASHAAL